MIMDKSLRRQRGLSLVELLVASAVGMMLMAGMIQIFVGNKQSYRVQEALSRLQENGRFALMFIERDIRMADYGGCGTRSEAVVLQNTLSTSASYLGDLATGIEGYEATSSSEWDRTPDASISSPIGGSDILTIRRAQGQSFKVVTHGGGTADVVLNSGIPFDDGDIVMIADCVGAAVFEIDSVSAGALQHSVNLDRDYLDGEVFRFDTVSYYVRNGTSGQPALYQRTGNNLQELIEGVEEMQIVYGEDTDADDLVDQYVTADAVSNWDDVISVNISLLLTTLEDNLTPTDDPQPYIFDGETYDGAANALPADNRLRRAFSSTVTLRNRTL
ncbi:MAG: PilW family protein [Gammaproteobacteria bacterium]|nr:PilW family protein [Gammaproteobacteria bacterium]